MHAKLLRIKFFSNYIMNNKIKLNDSIIPAVPFIWYREQELICPIENITQIHNIPHLPYLIIQRHVIKEANLYICLHSLLFYELHKTTINDNPMSIPNTYNININFEVKIVPLNTSEIIQVLGGLKINEYTSGSVFIHGGAFSPPGCLHFKVNEEKDKNCFICFIKCDSLKIEICCLFVLINDFD